MEHKIYCIFDKVSQSVMTTTQAPNGATCVRENIRFLTQVRPLKDLELYEVGSLDIQSLSITPQEPVLVPWDCYKVPTSKAESLAPLGIPEEEFQNIKE